MDFANAMKISASGMSANRTWMNVISANLANANTTRADNGEPYARRTLIYEATPVEESFESVFDDEVSGQLNEVRVVDVLPDGREFKEIYDPNHPDAGEDGIVRTPNISPVEEMALLMTATRSYEANLTALQMAKQMALKALELGK